MAPSLYDTRLEEHRRLIEESMERFLLRTDEAVPPELNRAMRYACEAGGKRIRPVLTLEFCRLCGGDPAQALPFACAMEMVHSYSLAHDDLPCMDNSPLRRGKPSVHAAFGEDMALLAGDGLLTRAFEVMLSPENRRGLPAESVLNAAFALADAAGAYGMVGGQVIDLSTENNETAGLDVLQAMDEGKTAALIEAACVLGCLAAHAGEEQIHAARVYAHGVGLAFQIRDDILDVIGDQATLGKKTGVDVHNGRRTYVSLLGVEKAQQLVEEYTEQAVQALAVFPGDSSYLADFARRLAQRMH